MNQSDRLGPVAISVAASPSPKEPSPVRPALGTPRLLGYRYPLVWFAVVWLLGTQLAQWSWFEDRLAVGWWFALAASLLLLSCLGCAISHAWLAGLGSLAAILATAVCFALATAPPRRDSLSDLATRKPQPIALRGILRSVPTWTPNPQFRVDQPDTEVWLTQWQVQWQSIRQGNQWHPIVCRSKLTVPGRLTHLLPGDEVQVFGTVRAVQSATNPGGANGSRRSRGQGLFVAVSADATHQIRKLSSGWQYLPMRLRGRAILRVDQNLRDYISSGRAALAAALVFGQREQVDWQEQQQLMVTGTLHLLAISGMHVEMIAGVLLLLCLLMSLQPRATLIVVVSACLLYAGLAGGRPPVLRAVILVSAYAVARYWGYQPRLFNLLALAGLVLMLLKPGDVYNVGVHLSFLAVITIGLFNDADSLLQTRRTALQNLIEERLSHWRRAALRGWRYLRSAVHISFWVWLMTCPLIWYHFNVVSPLSVPMNVVLVPPLMVGLLAGLLTGLLGWLAPVGWVTGRITEYSLGLIGWLVEFGYRLPLSHLWLPSPPLWWIVLFYACAVIWLVVLRTRRQSRLALLLLAWLAVGIGWYLPGPRGLTGWPQRQPALSQGELRCTFVDVGHGTCVLIELPDGRVWMYDAGHMGDILRSHEPIAQALWSLPTTRVDTLIFSHADADHYSAARGLLGRFRFGQLASTHRFWNSRAREVRAIMNEADRRGIPRLQWHAQSELLSDSPVTAEVLHPPDGFQCESNNADSLCLRLEYAGIGILLTGDLEGSGMVQLCEQTPRPSHILMAPHHGSLSHDATDLIKWCQPEVIVISGGQRTIRPAVIEKFSAAPRLGITFRDGAVQARIRSDGTYQMYHWRDSTWQPLAATPPAG